MMISGLIVAMCVVIVPDDDASGSRSAWRYVVPPPGDAPFESAPLRAIGLASEKPEDLVVKVKFRGDRQRYAQLRFGSPSSVRVAIVLDEIGRGAADLYVDANRNRRIETTDLAPGSNRTWRVPLDLAIVDGETTRYERRAIILRLGSHRHHVQLRRAGYLEGKVIFAGKSHGVRRDGRRWERALHRPPRPRLDRRERRRDAGTTSSEQFLSRRSSRSARHAIRSVRTRSGDGSR